MKLFGKGGKLNIIDILIILILVAAVVFVGVRLLSDKTDTLGSENAVTEPNLRFTVLVTDVHPELAAQVVQAVRRPGRHRRQHRRAHPPVQQQQARQRQGHCPRQHRRRGRLDRAAPDGGGGGRRFRRSLLRRHAGGSHRQGV